MMKRGMMVVVVVVCTAHQAHTSLAVHFHAVYC
jgi:hypothetical protein